MFHALPDQLIVLCFLGLLAWAACSDALEFKIPNAASIGIAALFPLYAVASPAPVAWVWSATIAVVVLCLGLALFARDLIGGGDVKLLSATALWAGPRFFLPMILVTALSGGALALLAWCLQRTQRHRMPAAPGGGAGASAATAPIQLPYGVAISVGAGLVGLRLLSG